MPDVTTRVVTMPDASRVALRRAAATLLLGAVGLGACADLLEVRNPGSLEEGQLANPALEQFLVNGAVGEFQFAYGTYVFWSGVLADETFTDHPSGYKEFARHAFDDLDAANEDVYESLHRARQSADDAADRIKAIRGAGAASSLNVARALVYGGYAYVLLGEGFCESPVDRSAALPSAELLSRGVARFDEGIAVASKSAADSAAARDLIHLAQVGAARAALGKGDMASARAYAAPVPESYQRWAWYSANSFRENNFLHVAARLDRPWLGVHPGFQALVDARIPKPAAPVPSLASHSILPPLRPSMYGGWSAAAPGTPIEVGDDIRFASGLEARYIVVEAGGPGGAMLDFVNARRSAGGKAPVSLSGSALVTELRVQRAIDFYLTGRRLGDLRRYAREGTDPFPSGRFPIGDGVYGTMHCFIVPRSEKASNPNYP